ncbi:deoxyribose-phosphate aldolase [Georgenia halophila]|uniref:Deoxyribose-phosphate aldolase n=1 Tax=Georgenia halophila TaxID=620889 RepID=A0ABP8KU77_9MICO
MTSQDLMEAAGRALGTPVTAAAVAGIVDHTLLKPEATAEQVDALVADARELGAYSVCISPSMLPLRNANGIKVAAVCGFPSGAHHAEVKAAEAAGCVGDGVDEIDMVVNLALATTGRYRAVEAEIAAVREAATTPVVLKVIIESAALTDEQIVGVCRAAEAAGADFVKTSTGFHPAGGASIHAVELMAETVGRRLGVKASGGIRTTGTALEMIAAGATRLGLSGTRAVVEDLPT